MLLSKVFYLLFLSFLISGCIQQGDVIEEKDHPAFDNGKSLLKVGKNQEALWMNSLPHAVLPNRRNLILSAVAYFFPSTPEKDPVAAIYHFGRYLLLEPNSQESSKVEQLIVTAEREILRKLPGEPYGDYLDSLKLKEENDRLKRELADLRARLGIPESQTTLPPASPATQVNKPAPVLAVPGNTPPVQPARPPGPTQMQTYVVQSGDSLYAISRKFYGDSSHIDLIFEANRDVMRSKNSLSVGQKLRIPPVPLNR